MKTFLPKLLLPFLLLLVQWCGAQWYSYNSFESKELTKNQLLGAALAKSNAALLEKYKTAPATSFLSVVDDNIAEIDAILKDSKYEQNRIQQQAELNQKIKAADAAISAATTDAEKKKLTDKMDTDKASLAYLADGKDKDSLKLRRQEFVYMKKQHRMVNFFPAANSHAAEAYFENSDTVINSEDNGVFSFENAYLNYLPNAKTLAAYTEPIGDFIGPVRLSLGLLLTAPASKEDTVTTEKFDKKRFNEKFKSGGGNVSLNIGFPLLHIKLPKYFDFKSYYSPRFSLDVPKDGESSNEFPLHAQWLAVDNQVKISTLQGNFTFLFCHRYTRVSGNSTFYDRMGFTGDQRKTFNFTTLTAGFIAKKKLALYYTWYAGSSKVVNGIGNNGSITANFQLD